MNDTDVIINRLARVAIDEITRLRSEFDEALTTVRTLTDEIAALTGDGE